MREDSCGTIRRIVIGTLVPARRIFQDCETRDGTNENFKRILKLHTAQRREMNDEAARGRKSENPRNMYGIESGWRAEGARAT